MAADYPGHVSGLGNWWDSVELWVAGLPFVPQVVIVMAVLVPLAAGLARLLDIVLSGALRLIGRGDPIAGTDHGACAGQDPENTEVER